MRKTRVAQLGLQTATEAREVAAKARRLARAASSGDVSERLLKVAEDLEREADEIDRKAVGGAEPKAQ